MNYNLRLCFKGFYFIVLIHLVFQNGLCGILPGDTTLNKNRMYIIAGSNLVGVAIVDYFLWENWFSSTPLRPFHFVNDLDHWNQMDKMGHMYSAFTLSNSLSSELKWANMSQNQAAWIAGLSSLLWTTSIDVMDGFSSKWGFSYYDFVANTLGSSLFIFQELQLKKQYVHMKWSFHPTIFPHHSNKLGKGLPEALHDYNGQTYWFSFNIRDLLKTDRIPSFLNIAIGYGAENMIDETQSEIELQFNESRNTKRIRQFYISPDINLEKFKTRSKFVKIFLTFLNGIKIPFPGLEINSNGDIRFHYLYF